MPLTQAPLGPITSNIIKKKSFSPLLKERIISIFLINAILAFILYLLLILKKTI